MPGNKICFELVREEKYIFRKRINSENYTQLYNCSYVHNRLSWSISDFYTRYFPDFKVHVNFPSNMNMSFHSRILCVQTFFYAWVYIHQTTMKKLCYSEKFNQQRWEALSEILSTILNGSFTSAYIRHLLSLYSIMQTKKIQKVR